LITHLGECLKNHAHELLSREDLQMMLDKLKESAPTIVGEVKSDGLKAGVLHQLLINLLRESVSISSLEKIVESAVVHSATANTVELLTEKVRADIGPLIVDRFRDSGGRVRVILLDRKLEHRLRQNSNGELIALQSDQLANLVDKYKQAWELASMKNESAAALVDSSVRRAMRQTIYRSLPQLSILAYNEIPSDMAIETVSIIQDQDVFAGAPMPSEAMTGVQGHPKESTTEHVSTPTRGVA
jgi:flagellar biosynthesis protein FlhA